MLVFSNVLLCVFFSVVGNQVTADAGDGYSREVKQLFKALKKHGFKYNIVKARKKMRQFADDPLDRKYAIAIINLYTQESSFYISLNKQMRESYPDNNTNLWKRAGDLINRGLDILGPKVYRTVYRGVKTLNNPPIAGEAYHFRSITSSSLADDTALGFAGFQNGVLFVIENVYGVLVESYSGIPMEEEVIIKSTNTYLVKSGPEVRNEYTMYYLDGQPDLNVPNRATTSHLEVVSEASAPGADDRYGKKLSDMDREKTPKRNDNTGAIESDIVEEYRPDVHNIDKAVKIDVSGTGKQTMLSPCVLFVILSVCFIEIL